MDRRDIPQQMAQRRNQRLFAILFCCHYNGHLAQTSDAKQPANTCYQGFTLLDDKLVNKRILHINHHKNAVVDVKQTILKRRHMAKFLY